MTGRFQVLAATVRLAVLVAGAGCRNERTVSQEIIPVIRQVAKESRIPVVNLHAALSNRPDSFPDGIHPDVTGAAMMAQVICYAIKK